MNMGTLFALAGFVVVILAHTAVLFRWGGKVTTLLEAHGEEIKTLRTRYHDEIAPSLARLSVALEFIEQRMEDRRGSGA